VKFGFRHTVPATSRAKERTRPRGLLTTARRRAQNRGMSTLPMRLLLILVSSGLFLALAVAARGGIDAFFSQPALIGLTVVLFALCAAALVAGGNLSPGVREDTSKRWVIAVFTAITLLLVFLPPWSDRKGIWIIDGVRAGRPVQRIGGDPARAPVGHGRGLRRDPPSELSRLGDRLAGLGPRVSLRDRRAPRGVARSAAAGAH
jgi:hypothetical protein